MIIIEVIIYILLALWIIVKVVDIELDTRAYRRKEVIRRSKKK